MLNKYYVKRIRINEKKKTFLTPFYSNLFNSYSKFLYILIYINIHKYFCILKNARKAAKSSEKHIYYIDICIILNEKKEITICHHKSLYYAEKKN